MRQLVQVMCAAALAACSESNAPTVIHSPQVRVAASDSSGIAPRRPGMTGALDPRTPMQRIEASMTAALTPVQLPPDGFSLATDAVHPDIACPPDDWNASRCWLMYTPYLGSDNAYENPAFLYAANDTTWRTPAGVLNPIVPYPGFGRYNSDPDHAFDPVTRRLVQIYRVVADGYNDIMIMSTGDARQWTAPTLAFREPNHDAVSPALIIESDRTAKIWYVKSGGDGCQSKATSVQLRTARPDSKNSYEGAVWSAPAAVDLGLPNANVWHLDVEPLDGGYIALIAAYQKGLSCGSSDLWLATSDDGRHWRSYAIPILWRNMRFAAQRGLMTWYRGTLRYDEDTGLLHLWPSAFVGWNWTIYHAAVNLRDLLAVLGEAKSSDLHALGALAAAMPVAAPTIEMP